MNNSFIVSGSLFGDEGKGTLVDYLISENSIKQNVRYNGGSQASHTVYKNNKPYRFSQLGSNMFNDNNRTFLSKNTIVNVFNLYNEAQIFSNYDKSKTKDLLDRIYIDSNSLVVTPFHSLIDRLIELNSKDKRGAVGTGVSLTRKLFEEKGIGIIINDLLTDNFEETIKILFELTKKELSNNKISLDKYISKQEIIDLTKDYKYIANCYRNIMNSCNFNIVNSINDFYTKDKDIVMEGSQGFLIDKDYGIKPNTCFVDTTNRYGIVLSEELNYKTNLIGASSILTSRHGNGILPTYDELFNSYINDTNQDHTVYQGCPRYGWYDTVLMRYSNKYSFYDEIFVSGLDLLSGLNNIHICDYYIYKGVIDEEFKRIFEYYIDNNEIVILNIKENCSKLKEYLLHCNPHYITMNGYTIKNRINNIDDIPIECINYLEQIESLIKVPITLLGFGPHREDKIRRLIK